MTPAINALYVRSSQGAGVVQNTAQRLDLPVCLVAAVVLVESAGEPLAVRFEPPYRYYWDNHSGAAYRRVTPAERASETAPPDFAALPSIGSRDTEWALQAASWGPMQVMGAVARELGFRGWFPALCTWPVGVDYGTLHLRKLRNRFLDQYGWEGVAAAYNAGSPNRLDNGQWANQSYVDKVRAMGGFEGL